MKEMPSFESEESLESMEERLVVMLKEKGIEDSETKKILNAWADRLEKWVVESGMPTAGIELNLKWARMYFKAGFTDSAVENFEHAREQAFNEGKDELLKAIDAEMDKLESSLGLQE
ncbi:MAG: hypothetical protein Q7R98_00995 [Candidatus Jorgensenbacteria bacterium]|nr:hypothetical protein [Candidatus Jorgensenbacteria bacterium]